TVAEATEPTLAPQPVADTEDSDSDGSSGGFRLADYSGIIIALVAVGIFFGARALGSRS
ncbi:MAG TPA: hypothetical protein GX702_15090, partial [Chloroflexi bacterium]|nr:hypothetical protein [Chloroflexota bacterium]